MKSEIQLSIRKNEHHLDKIMSNTSSDNKLIHEQIQYLEFISSDLERAKKFYSASFGWSFTDYGPQYTAFDGKYVDGGFTVGTPVNGSILVVLYSNDLFATRDKITQAGGIIVKDIFSFPGGKRFQFKDPDGYELAVWATE
ncbi:VOC family protein [Sphingobacterium sp. HMA12]|uniref:VOC family protein n=1 Tax=Sphingobacterium sp. HMA12 TaxID=2050894 RepID=UPI001F3674EF|nr:VOC family protein [Sphingobacterium sp. HMA12]